MARCRTSVICIIVAAFAASLLPAPIPASAKIPAVYRKVASDRVGKGVEHFRLVRRNPAETINVARIKHGAPFELRAVPAQDKIGDGLERTSAICRRVGCAIGVNGDFWKPGTDIPVGGVVSFGRLLRPPSVRHEQLTLTPDGALRAGPLKFSASLVTDDVRSHAIGGVNRQPRVDETVLFTPAFGRSTRTKKGTIEVTVRAEKGKNVSLLNKTTIVRIPKNGNQAGNVPIPPDGAVLSGRGRGGRLLRDVLARVRAKSISPEALLRIESTPKAVESIGGSPVLVRGGTVVPVSARTSFVTGRHPRTLIGWVPNGDLLLVTVDGRQSGYSEGMTLAEAARFMLNLGATDVLNLDGGGSTTFVKRGDVKNRPSDRAIRTLRGRKLVHNAPTAPSTLGNVERPVAIGLMLMPKATKIAAPAPAALRELSIPVDDDAERGTQIQVSDPASDPTGAAPEIVYRYSDTSWPIQATAVGLVALAIALAGAYTGYTHGTRTHTRRRRRIAG